MKVIRYGIVWYFANDLAASESELQIYFNQIAENSLLFSTHFRAQFCPNVSCSRMEKRYKHKEFMFLSVNQTLKVLNV